MRSLSNLLSQWALEKVETNSTFWRRKVSHVALNHSGMQEAVHVSRAFRDCAAGSFRRKRRQNSLLRGDEKKTFDEYTVVAKNFAAAKFSPRVRGEFAEQFISWKSLKRTSSWVQDHLELRH